MAFGLLCSLFTPIPVGLILTGQGGLQAFLGSFMVIGTFPFLKYKTNYTPPRNSSHPYLLITSGFRKESTTGALAQIGPRAVWS